MCRLYCRLDGLDINNTSTVHLSQANVQFINHDLLYGDSFSLLYSNSSTHNVYPDLVQSYITYKFKRQLQFKIDLDLVFLPWHHVLQGL